MNVEFPSMKNNLPEIMANLDCGYGPPCTGPAECAAPGICDHGSCITPCDTNNPCAGGQSCPVDRCVQSCLIDENCPASMVCFRGECIRDPGLGVGCVPDLWTGCGVFNDCNTYDNQMHLQADPQATANALNAEGYPGGSEAVFQSVACVANPATYCSNDEHCSADPNVANPVGCPGYRPDAVRILVQVTDAGNQGSSCMSNVALAGAALSDAAVDIKYVGIYGTQDDGGSPCGNAATCTTQIGTAAGTVDINGDPFVYSAFDAAIVAATQQAVMDIVRGVPLRVTIAAMDEPDDAGDSLQFLDYLEVNVTGQDNCTFVTPTEDTDANLHDDAFPALLGGTPVCWNVIPVPINTTVPPTDEPQLFRARLTVYGDGSPLDSRVVYFLVPPKPAEVPPEPPA
jgi:hypothetical protein